MNPKIKNISILDCTLRDGSYLIDYQFTAEDTYIICLGLMKAGFELIEIGHGTGLGSSEAGKGKAAATDKEYLQAARSALDGSAAKFGMFFIPGIGKIEDLEIAAGYGMSFVRIGTNITEIEQAKPYIEKAKEFGMMVSSNLMKSYAVPIDEFIRRAKMADHFGADIIAVVDSAGGMFPQDVREYVFRLKGITDKQIGFHGHNNLQLAIANTLEAVMAGASVVDSSLQGMGRSAGNAQTEVLAMVLEKLGYSTGIDPYKAMDLGERIIKPMMSKEQGVDDISLVSGIAQFHSSFYRTVYEVAEKYHIDPRRLIVEVSEIDRVHVTPELAETTALKITGDIQKNRPCDADITFNIDIMKWKTSGNPVEQVQTIVSEIVSQSKKTGKESVFSITLSKSERTVFPFVRQSLSFVMGNVEASDINEARSLMEALDGRVDWLLLDESCPELRESEFGKHIHKSNFTWYSEERALRLSVGTLLSRKRQEGVVLILADNEDTEIMNLSLKQQGISVVSNNVIRKDNNELSRVTAIVSFGAEYARVLTAVHVPLLSKNAVIYAARPDSFPPSFWEAALAEGLSVCRVDSRTGFSAEISLVIETKKMIGVMGSVTLSGVSVVAGGIIGRRGSVVVDSIKNPTRVIGIADGLGGILPPEKETPYLEIKEKVKEQIIKNMYKKEF